MLVVMELHKHVTELYAGAQTISRKTKILEAAVEAHLPPPKRVMDALNALKLAAAEHESAILAKLTELETPAEVPQEAKAEPPKDTK